MADSEERIRMVESQLLGDESLRGDLDDALATRLLDWVLPVARQIAEQTWGINDDPAEAVFLSQLDELRRVARRVGKLVGNLSSAPDPSETLELLEKIQGSAVQVRALRGASSLNTESMAARLPMLPPADALAALLTALDSGGEA
jgi:hypothetical protein